MRLIDAEKLKERMCRQCNAECGDDPCEPDECFVRTVILDAPTINAVEVVHGAWELYPSHLDRRCSVCKIEYDLRRFNVRAKYCPNCGAKMDGERKGNGR